MQLQYRFLKSTFVAASLALMLSGCSGGGGLLGTGLLDAKATVPQAINVPVGNALALPPDLQLAAPTQTSDAYQPNGAVAPIAAAPAAKSKIALAQPALKGSAGLYGGSPITAPTGDVFDQYGISKTKPDGSKKTVQELNEELRAAILKKRRQANPSYGTIGNVGEIFKDQ